MTSFQVIAYQIVNEVLIINSWVRVQWLKVAYNYSNSAVNKCPPSVQAHHRQTVNKCVLFTEYCAT